MKGVALIIESDLPLAEGIHVSLFIRAIIFFVDFTPLALKAMSVDWSFKNETVSFESWRK